MGHVKQPHQIGGILATRTRRWWTLSRRGGALTAVVGLLLQCLILAVHVPPADAAELLSPFHDPGAFCGALADYGSPASTDQSGPNTPVHHPVVCPICLSLQAAGPGLMPVVAMLFVPVPIVLPMPPVAHAASPDRVGWFAPNSRAPPVSL